MPHSHYCVYVILAALNINTEANVMWLLEKTISQLTMNEYYENSIRIGGVWDGVLLKVLCTDNKLSNNIIEIEKLDYDIFLPDALVTPNGELHDDVFIQLELDEEIVPQMGKLNEKGEFVSYLEMGPPCTDEESKERLKEYDQILKEMWKDKLIRVTRKYPGHFVVCCDVYDS